MFKPAELPGSLPARSVEIVVDGRTLSVRAGQPLATALLEAGIRPLRLTPVSGAAREPVCLMGVCFECLVDVDGQRNVQSCMVEVRAGMRVALPQGARDIGSGHES